MSSNLALKVTEWTGKYFINEAYRPLAERLVAKYSELEWAPVQNILFVENTEDKRKQNNKTIYAKVSKVPGRWEEIIHQITGKQFSFMIEIFKENCQGMSREQVIALLYHELRHIQLVVGQTKVDIVGHEIDDWANMIEKLGVNWAETKAIIPDLLDENITCWDDIDGPMILFPEMGLRVVK